METITLTYKRPPDRVNYFQQLLLYEDADVIVTAQRVKPSSAIILNGKTVLADDFIAVWFVFTGLWYDVGKIYNLKHEWTGYYCDIMMPVKRSKTQFEITDLFLDLWISPDGSYEIQDEDEFAEAIRHGVIDTELAKSAQNALDALIAEVESGKFPRQHVIAEFESCPSQFFSNHGIILNGLT